MNTDNTSHLNYPERIHLTQEEMDDLNYFYEIKISDFKLLTPQDPKNAPIKITP